MHFTTTPRRDKSRLTQSGDTNGTASVSHDAAGNLHADHIATARMITRQGDTIVWRWDMAEAFGGSPPEDNPSTLGVFIYHQRFPGQIFDAESGLLQNWHREYNARLGRYRRSLKASAGW